MGSKLAKYELSKWLLSLKREAQYRCQQCTVLASVCPEVLVTEPPTQEKDERHLGTGQARGRVYLTSERLIWAPRDNDRVGWSVFVARICLLRTLVDTGGHFQLVAYVDNHVLSIRFASMARAEQMMQTIANIRFENKLRHHLVPEYEPGAPPSYRASEESLQYAFGRQGLDSVGRGKEFRQLVTTSGLGPQTIHIAGHDGYKVGPEAHAIIYTNVSDATEAENVDEPC